MVSVVTMKQDRPAFKRPPPKPRKQDRVDLQRPLAKATKGVGRGGARKNYKAPTEFNHLPSDVQSKIFGHVMRTPLTKPRMFRGQNGVMVPSSTDSSLPGGMKEVARLASTSKSFHEPLSKLMGGTHKMNNGFGLTHLEHQYRTRDHMHAGVKSGHLHDLEAMNKGNKWARVGSRVTFGLDDRTKPYVSKNAHPGYFGFNVDRLAANTDRALRRVPGKAVAVANKQSNRLMKRIGNPNRAVSRKMGGDFFDESFPNPFN